MAAGGQARSSGEWTTSARTSPGEERDVTSAAPGELARMVDELEAWKVALGLPDIDAPAGAGRLEPRGSHCARASSPCSL